MLLLLGIPFILRSMKVAAMYAWAPVVPDPAIRSDNWGDGRFGASRNGHIHQGVDILVHKGQTISAPFDGVVNRVAYPYADDLKWKGLEMRGTTNGPWAGYTVKMFYMLPDESLIGKPVFQGQPIGIAQAISEKYSPEMQNHIHIELRKGAQVIDPTPFLIDYAA